MVEALIPAAQSRTGLRLRGLRRRRGVLMTQVVLMAVIAAAVLPQVISPHDPYTQDLSRRLTPPVFIRGGSWMHVLGTDALGRDMLSRVIYGARVSLMVATIAVIVSGTIGVVLGLLAGYFGGPLDEIVMRATEVQLAFPFILTAVALVSVLGASLRNIVIVLGVTGWTTYARVVRGISLSLKEREFVEAARAIGCSHTRILRRYLFPNVIGTVTVLGTFAFAAFIIAESGLSYLGLGVQPPTPSWGVMLADGYIYLRIAWWVTVFPGLVLMLTALSINVLGDWVRDLLDPRLRNID